MYDKSKIRGEPPASRFIVALFPHETIPEVMFDITGAYASYYYNNNPADGAMHPHYGTAYMYKAKWTWKATPRQEDLRLQPFNLPRGKENTIVRQEWQAFKMLCEGVPRFKCVVHGKDHFGDSVADPDHYKIVQGHGYYQKVDGIKPGYTEYQYYATNLY